MEYRDKDYIYDSETGEVFHARDKGSVKAGDLCSSKTSHGYLRVTIGRREKLQHRIAWFLVKGYWPSQIDHINGIRSDNRLCNLREVDNVNQRRNQKMDKRNNTGSTGVRFKNGRWEARITVNNRCLHLGRFDDWHGAFNKRKTAEVEYGFHPNHGRER